MLWLTLYSLSCPWMVSRCTRVHVRAMAVLFRTLILTSVGAALGSGCLGQSRAYIRQSAQPSHAPALPSAGPLAILRFFKGRNCGRFSLFQFSFRGATIGQFWIPWLSSFGSSRHYGCTSVCTIPLLTFMLHIFYLIIKYPELEGAHSACMLFKMSVF